MMISGTENNDSQLAPGEFETVGWRSIGLSMLIHISLLVALALLWTSRVTGSGEEGPRRVEIVLASAQEEPEYFEEADLADTSPEAAAASPSDALPNETPPIDVSQVVDEVAPIELPLPGLSSTEMARPADRPAFAPEVELTDAQKEMLAKESAAFEAQRPKGPPTTLRVFGSGDLSGRKFVFVIDRSKSMGSQGLNVLHAATQELTSAINSLEPYHQFQIVAYHHRTITITRRELLNATEENTRKVGTFITGLAAFGGTEHEKALNMALAMDPDVIVLMTDGGLPVLNESQLTRIRRSADGTQIHCIQFGSGPSRETKPFMRQLAGQNFGTYRYVDVTQWDLD